MTKTKLQATITELVGFIIHESCQNPLGISMTHYFYPRSHSWQPQIAEIDDFGDYHTFVAWAGHIFNRPDWIEFPQTQLRLWQHFKHPSGWYPAQIDCSTGKPLGSPWIVSLYDLQDTVLGFYELWSLTQEPIYLQELEQLFDLLSRVAANNRGFLPNRIIRPSYSSLPWSTSNPMVTGLIAEHLLLASRSTSHTKYQRLAHTILTPWFSTNLYQKHSLLPQSHHPFLSPFSTTKIFKEHTNFLYALFQHPNKYRHHIEELLDHLRQFQTPSGAFHTFFDSRPGTVLPQNFDKAQNFAAIDLYTQASLSFSDHYLAIAQLAAEFWLSYQNPRTHLIPDYIKPNGTLAYPIAKLDQTADFYSSLLRLYSVTEDSRYLKLAQKGALVLKQTFGAKSWWHRIVNTRTGHPPQDSSVPPSDRPVNRNLTKYIGGALRFYLSLYQVLLGKHMYQDHQLWLMSRDR